VLHRTRSILLVVDILLCAAAVVPAIATAQTPWPGNGLINFIVPFSPGGGADITARLVSQKMGPALGQSIVVQNKPGGNGQIGEGYVARSTPDGYTVLFDASPFVANQYLYKAPFDPLKDFTAVGVMARYPLIATVTPGFGAKSIAELISMAKQKPGRIFYGSIGVGSIQGLAGAAFARKANINLGAVPYKGGAPATVAVMSGEIQLLFGNGASALPPVRAGKLRALAVTGETRLAALPDVPTLSEQGLKGMDLYEWNAMFVPAATPIAVVNKLADALTHAMNAPDIVKTVSDLGGERLPGGRTGALAFLKQQSRFLGNVIRENHIRPSAE
jgi:tripartite-type tricarboxylate transporter receptor subunit TctC